MREFWVASGHQLARTTAEGRLEVTDELLLAWLARPEIVPPDEACEGERRLHARLAAAPRAPVAPGEIAALADPDARENWEHFLGFRDRMIAAGTVEEAYLGIVRAGARVAPIFLDQLVHLVMRNALEGADDPFVLRAAELFWRRQAGRVRDGALVLVDAERMEALEAEAHESPLMAMFQSPEERVEVMTAENAWTYWSRSDAHDLTLPFGSEARARAGLAAAIAAFLRHLIGIDALVEPLPAVEEPDLRWYVGLDAEGTAIGNALWRGEAAARDRLVGLFRMTVTRPGVLEARMEGRPIYLLMGLGADGSLRLKPQNLVMGLPLAAEAGGAAWRASV